MTYETIPRIPEGKQLILRSGLKGDHETVKVDLQKAENYINRAMTGS